MCNIDYSKYLFDSVADSSSDEALASLSNCLTNNRIFFTLNSYIERTIEEYRQVINEVMKEFRRRFAYEAVAEWYFEDRTKSGLKTRLHVHGMISNIPEKYYPYGYVTDWLSKQFHKLIGKPKNRHSVSARIEWSHDNKAVADYCQKQGKLDMNNVFCPIN